jgi:hypothetical protein
MTITFSRSHGGYVVRLDRNLIGLLLAPRPHEQDAKRLAADFLLLDHAA